MQGATARLRSVLLNYVRKNYNSPIQSCAVRQSSFFSSPFLEDLGDVKRKYEVTSVPEEWKYVERALPPKIIPEPAVKAEYPSGWKPQAKSFKDKPYFIERTKNHMLPVYMITKQFGMRRLTIVRRIKGDIWQLQKELCEFLQPNQIKPIRSQVHELAGFLLFHGDHVNAIKYYLLKHNY